MYIQRNHTKGKNGKTYSATLLCSKYREGGKVKTKVELNLSSLPENIILSIENALKSNNEETVLLKDIKVEKCVDYGYLFLIHQLMKQLRIDAVLDKVLPANVATHVKAMILGKIITGGSKLSIYNWLLREPYAGKLLGVETKGLKVDHLYSSLGVLPTYQKNIEKKWFQHHKDNRRCIYLYDITSTYFEGVQNELAAFGYNRDGKKGKMQICIGLVTDEDGFPLKIEVFEGNTSDSSTVRAQIKSLKNELGVEELIFVGDRGMQIMYHLDEDEELKDSGIGFITGLTRSHIEELMGRGVIQLSLFGKELAEVTDENKRYVLSVNPDLEASELYYLAHKKDSVQSSLSAIEASWEKRRRKNIENAQAIEAGKTTNKKLKTCFDLKDIDKYKRRVDRVLEDKKMTKFYSIDTIDNNIFKVTFDEDKFSQSESLCGKYVVCTNVNAEKLNKTQVRGQYKNLQNVEHNFRDIKGDNISIRPVFHRNERQTRGHVLVCFFACAIIKNMEDKIFPFLIKYNNDNKVNLSFNDIVEEMKKVKLCELRIGKGVKSMTYPDLNTLQEKVFQLFNINPKNMIA
jgi:Transposase